VARQSRLWRDCAEKASAGKEFHPEILLGFRRMGRAARAPGHAKRVTPLHRETSALGERTACSGLPARSKKRSVPHGFYGQSRQGRDFRAGHGL